MKPQRSNIEKQATPISDVIKQRLEIMRLFTSRGKQSSSTLTLKSIQQQQQPRFQSNDQQDVQFPSSINEDQKEKQLSIRNKAQLSIPVASFSNLSHVSPRQQKGPFILSASSLQENNNNNNNLGQKTLIIEGVGGQTQTKKHLKVPPLKLQLTEQKQKGYQIKSKGELGSSDPSMLTTARTAFTQRNRTSHTDFNTTGYLSVYSSSSFRGSVSTQENLGSPPNMGMSGAAAPLTLREFSETYTSPLSNRFTKSRDTQLFSSSSSKNQNQIKESIETTTTTTANQRDQFRSKQISNTNKLVSPRHNLKKQSFAAATSSVHEKLRIFTTEESEISTENRFDDVKGMSTLIDEVIPIRVNSIKGNQEQHKFFRSTLNDFNLKNKKVVRLQNNKSSDEESDGHQRIVKFHQIQMNQSEHFSPRINSQQQQRTRNSVRDEDYFKKENLKEDSFNVFGQFANHARVLQKSLEDTLKSKTGSTNIINYISMKSKDIQHKLTTMNEEKNEEMQRQSYMQLAKLTIGSLERILGILQKAESVIFDRDRLDEIYSSMCQESMRSKNLVVAVICFKAYAKTLLLSKNYSKAIETYKLCKHSTSESPFLFRYRLNAYKNIGKCFSKLKLYDFALFYFGKMLRIAWYLNDVDLELKAYDMIGMQYYYQGKLDIAQYYHNKMIFSLSEGPDSDLKRLGISKIDNFLRKYLDNNSFSDNLLFKKRMQQTKSLDESDDYYISSDSDEDFELPISNSSLKKAQITDQIDENTSDQQDGTQKKRKNNGVLFTDSDYRQKEQVKNQANENIRIAAVELARKAAQALPISKKANAISLKQIKGATKVAYRLNHLSVNREIENYQIIDTRVTRLKNFDFTSHMFDQNDKNVKVKIKNIFENLTENFLFSVSNLTMILNRTNSVSIPQKQLRRFGFSTPQLNPLLSSQSN